MKAVNCGYYNHDLKKKGPLIEVDDRKVQEMECSKCGISTYYPEEAFTQ